ncbi:DEAD/DEAH box helicase [Dongia soli]|uniref:DEAD/DEAH box helicase n=1 Tax=Dongia soli TaxID=600628 RepID=A0ABU5EB63_9PROT|nr:DEAD/DEAH box helicase [Dongia soli]MDY0883499.1 DEAD/DEAH box helicase [Dongia soli]
MPFPAINPALDRALAERNYLEPTPVQLAVLQDEAAGRDLLVSAQTGSGKTVAFGLAFAPTILGSAERFPRPGAPLALIIAPTRELAMQVHGELSWLYAASGARVVSCVGGMDARREARALADGCHIVVGTPGRLRDHLERGQIDTSELRAVVLDEADEMLDLGFREDLEFLLDATPPQRRTLLFSATIAKDIAALAREYQRDALRIDTLQQNEPHGDIEYRAIRVGARDTEHAVVNVLRHIEPRASIIFCHTREAVRRLHGSLLERGFDVVALSGELTQNERSHALQALRDGHARVCVATDVAARGLDLPDLRLVIHADIPTNRATLLHRSGRTGRAGRKGICVLIVPHAKRRRVEQLLNGANIKSVWSDPPTADAIRALDRERMLQDPVLTEPVTEEDLIQARALLDARSAEEVAAALIRLYRARLPEPEDLFIEPFREERRRPRYEDDGEGGGRGRRRSEGQSEGRVPREYRDGGENMVQFRISAGRRQNADPKWLLPMLCRRGQISKKEIGAIRIFDNETTVDITQDVAARFIDAIRQTGGNDVRIEPADSPRGKRGERPPRPAHADGSAPDRKEHGERKGYGKDKKKDKRPANGAKPDRSKSEGGDRPPRRDKREAAEANAKKFKKKLKKLQKR